LSSWFKDYLYIPLGGSKVSKLRWLLNIFIVFLVSGLWHGAGWTFVCWGGLHGLYLILGHIMKSSREKCSSFFCLHKFPFLLKFFRVFITFNLVSFAWIFFRANSLADAFYVITHLFSGLSFSISELLVGTITIPYLIIAFLSIFFMEFIHLIQRRVHIRQFLDDKPLIIRWSIYCILIFAILIFGVYEEIPFIYFQF